MSLSTELKENNHKKSDTYKPDVEYNKAERGCKDEINVEEHVQEVSSLPDIEKENEINTEVEKKSEDVIISKNEIHRDKKNYNNLIVVLAIIIILVAGFIFFKKPSNDNIKNIQAQEQKTNGIEDNKSIELSKSKVDAEIAKTKADAEIVKAKADAEIAKAKADAEIAKAKADAELAKAKEEAKPINVGKTINKEALQKNEKIGFDNNEISVYLEDGIKYYENGKYELSIEKMKEVIRRDRTNYIALKYIAKAQNKLNRIDQEFEKPTVGRSW